RWRDWRPGPDRVEQLIRRHQAAGTCRQVLEDRERLRSERQVHSLAHEPAARPVETVGPERDDLAVGIHEARRPTTEPEAPRCPSDGRRSMAPHEKLNAFLIAFS